MQFWQTAAQKQLTDVNSRSVARPFRSGSLHSPVNHEATKPLKVTDHDPASLGFDPEWSKPRESARQCLRLHAEAGCNHCLVPWQADHRFAGVAWLRELEQKVAQALGRRAQCQLLDLLYETAQMDRHRSHHVEAELRISLQMVEEGLGFDDQ